MARRKFVKYPSTVSASKKINAYTMSRQEYVEDFMMNNDCSQQVANAAYAAARNGNTSQGVRALYKLAKLANDEGVDAEVVQDIAWNNYDNFDTDLSKQLDRLAKADGREDLIGILS